MNALTLRRDNPAAMNRAQAKLAIRHTAQALDSCVLFAGNSEIVITHGEEIYRLRLTRQNRLILTK